MEPDYYLDLFNNREKAIAIWLLIFGVWALSRREVRISMAGVLKALFQKKVAPVLVGMLIYVAFIVWGFHTIQVWDISLIKDTILWLVSTAFVLLLNVPKVMNDDHFFKRVLMDSLKLIVVLEFIVNLYAFSLGVELVLVPFLFILVSLSIVAGSQERYQQVKKIFDFMLAAIGFVFIIYALANILGDFRAFANTDNLRAFALPPLLTMTYLPFLYFFALIMAYESLFVRLDIFLGKRDKALARFAKRRVFAMCFVDLPKLNRFAKEYAKEITRLENKDDVLRIVASFSVRG